MQQSSRNESGDGHEQPRPHLHQGQFDGRAYSFRGHDDADVDGAFSRYPVRADLNDKRAEPNDSPFVFDPSQAIAIDFRRVAEIDQRYFLHGSCPPAMAESHLIERLTKGQSSDNAGLASFALSESQHNCSQAPSVQQPVTSIDPILIPVSPGLHLGALDKSSASKIRTIPTTKSVGIFIGHAAVLS